MRWGKQISGIITAAMVTATLLAGGSPSLAAAPKAGAACSPAGKTISSGKSTFTCVKSGKKLVWKASAAAKPAPEPKPTESSTTAPAFQGLAPSENAAAAWTRSGWVKPSGAAATISAASANFKSYISTTRNPNSKVTVWAETGADPVLVNWVTKGSQLVADSFETPGAMNQFNDVLAVSRKYLVDTFTTLYDSRYADAQAGAWDSGNPAWGGRTSNAWSLANITKNNGMVNDRVGMAQTAGHEYFHAIQENFVNASGTNCGPCGTPQWFWEGPAMFVGLQTANQLGFVDYTADGRPTSVNRVHRFPTAKLKLEDVSVNTPPSVDPYGIGEIATEFLVANVGMAKFVDIYRQIGAGASFAVAFEKATGVPLSDFYLMFEDARTDLGIPQE